MHLLMLTDARTRVGETEVSDVSRLESYINATESLSVWVVGVERRSKAKCPKL